MGPSSVHFIIGVNCLLLWLHVFPIIEVTPVDLLSLPSFFRVLPNRETDFSRGSTWIPWTGQGLYPDPSVRREGLVPRPGSRTSVIRVHTGVRHEEGWRVWGWRLVGGTECNGWTEWDGGSRGSFVSEVDLQVPPSIRNVNVRSWNLIQFRHKI